MKEFIEILKDVKQLFILIIASTFSQLMLYLRCHMLPLILTSNNEESRVTRLVTGHFFNPLKMLILYPVLQAGPGLLAIVRTATSRPPPGKCPRRAGALRGNPAWTVSGLMVSKIFYRASKSATAGTCHALIPKMISLLL